MHIFVILNYNLPYPHLDFNPKLKVYLTDHNVQRVQNCFKIAHLILPDSLTIWNFIRLLAFLVDDNDEHQNENFSKDTQEGPEGSQVTPHTKC